MIAHSDVEAKLCGTRCAAKHERDGTVRKHAVRMTETFECIHIFVFRSFRTAALVVTAEGLWSQ
jgi:hypothetical protein